MKLKAWQKKKDAILQGHTLKVSESVAKLHNNPWDAQGLMNSSGTSFFSENNMSEA